VAGSLSTCHAVYSEFANSVDGVEDKDSILPELMMNFIDAARFRELRRVYDWELKQRVGISLHQWATGRLPNRLKMHKLVLNAGLSILKSAPFKCQLICAGFVGGRGMFFCASMKGKLQEETSPGVYAIGSGAVKAIEHFNRRGQNVHTGLPRALLHLYEAMHIAQSSTVGPPPKLAIVIRNRADAVYVYPLQSLEAWRKTYESRASTHNLDDSGVAAKEIQFKLRFLKESDTEAS
jgi:hypothetical protein